MTLQSNRMRLVASCLLLSSIDAFAPSLLRSSSSTARGWISSSFVNDHNNRIPTFATSSPDESVMDVEFEKIENVYSDQRSDTSSTSPTNLLDLSLDMDSDWKDTRIPFVEARGNSYIDCKLAFCADLDGITYGIGVPFEAAAAMTLEMPDGAVAYLKPDDDDNVELMEIMAAKLQELVGQDLFLKKTPKILTIAGDLDKYTKDWIDDIFSQTVDKETLLDDSDEGLDFFYDFMKRELGEEEFQKTLEEDMDEEFSEDLLEFFNIPGLGDQKDDVEGINEMLESMLSLDQQSQFDEISEDLDHEGVALKLVSFNFKDGKSYSLVKLLKPFTIVGKYVNDKDDLRFELLTADEEKLIIPRLETLCKKDLEAAGLSLGE